MTTTYHKEKLFHLLCHDIECTLILLYCIHLTGLRHIFGDNISMVITDISDQGINTKPKTK